MPATVADAHGRVGAVVVTAPTNVDAAVALSEILAEDHPLDETLVVYPDGVNWKVSEFLEQVIDPARYGTTHHRNIVVADAHQAQAAAHDKLLKSLEEPFTDTTFWLCHPATASLPPTLLGRAAVIVPLEGPTIEQARERLAGYGLTADQADAFMSKADGDLNLAAAAAKFDMGEVLDRFAQGPYTSTPHLTAGQVLLAAAHLAIALGHKTKRAPAAPRGKGHLDTPDLAKLKPEQRARLRRLVARLLDRWETELLASTARVSTAPQMRDLERALDGIAAAREGSRYNTPQATVVTRALSAMPNSP